MQIVVSLEIVTGILPGERKENLQFTAGNRSNSSICLSY